MCAATVEDAKWIADNCPSGTTVEIYEDDDPGPLGKPEAAHIDTDSPNKGWDPTDPDVGIRGISCQMMNKNKHEKATSKFFFFSAF